MATDFDRYFAAAHAVRGRFGHREHVHVAWMALQDHELSDAIALVCDGIRETARYQNVPQKYHYTVSATWVRLVAHHVAETPDDDFDQLVTRSPALLDKRLLVRHYTSSLLASDAARRGWVEPDLAPLPAIG